MKNHLNENKDAGMSDDDIERLEMEIEEIKSRIERLRMDIDFANEIKLNIQAM